MANALNQGQKLTNKKSKHNGLGSWLKWYTSA
jgi:hypothetical protein